MNRSRILLTSPVGSVGFVSTRPSQGSPQIGPPVFTSSPGFGGLVARSEGASGAQGFAWTHTRRATCFQAVFGLEVSQVVGLSYGDHDMRYF